MFFTKKLFSLLLYFYTSGWFKPFGTPTNFCTRIFFLLCIFLEFLDTLFGGHLQIWVLFCFSFIFAFVGCFMPVFFSMWNLTAQMRGFHADKRPCLYSFSPSANSFFQKISIILGSIPADSNLLQEAVLLQAVSGHSGDVHQLPFISKISPAVAAHCFLFSDSHIFSFAVTVYSQFESFVD